MEDYKMIPKLLICSSCEVTVPYPTNLRQQRLKLCDYCYSKHLEAASNHNQLNLNGGNMAKLIDEAKAYEAKAKVNNIAELTTVSTELDVKEDLEAEFPYKYVQVEGLKYKVPSSVLANLKAILEENPNLKKFKVKRTGEGMDTRYTVIPLQ
jgi:hypothetical protein